MRRIEPEHEPVEKPPPAARAFDEQPVHLRRQPQHAQAFAERRLAAGRLAVDADDAALATLRLAPGADPDRPSACHDGRRHGPAIPTLPSPVCGG
jgi:hypothetical protein